MYKTQGQSLYYEIGQIQQILRNPREQNFSYILMPSKT